MLQNSCQSSINFIDDSIKHIEKAINLSLKFEHNPDKISKIKAIYTNIQSLKFSNNVSNDKLLDIEKQINILLSSNNNLFNLNESKDSLDDSETYDTSKSGISVVTNNSSQVVYTKWNEPLLLIEFCQLALKVKNFKLSEKSSEYFKYQLLLAEFIFNVNINQIEDILSERAIQYIIKVWEYGIPLLQPQFKQYYYPYLKRCYEVLTQISSPLYSLYSIIYAKLYIKYAYKYCFDKKKLEESFEYKNIELKMKASSMENTTFSKIEEALAMINQLDLKSKNIDGLKSSIYKILKILIPKHENHPFTSIIPLMDSKFSINYELDDSNNISQLKFFIEVLKLLLNITYNIKYWELVYEIASYIICHDFSNFPDHDIYFKIIRADALIKRLEALFNIKQDMVSKNNNIVNIKQEEKKVNSNTIIYLLINQYLIKSEIDKMANENEDIEFNDIEDEENQNFKNNKEKDVDPKSSLRGKRISKKQEVEEELYSNEIREIRKLYGKLIPTFNDNNYLKRVLFNENDVFSSATVDNEFPKRYNFEKWAVYERIEEILVENFNEENLNIKKKIRSNESIIKNLKGKPLSEMQECIHIANEIFKAVDFNNSNSECGLKIKMSFYELWGKIQSIEGQTIIVNESNTDTIICSLIETLRIENVHKSNLSKEKTNALLYKLINITKTIDIKNCATSVELWLLIVQSAINVNNFNVAFLCINNYNYQRFWIIKALLKFNDLIHIMIENKNFYEKVNDMHMKALKYFPIFIKIIETLYNISLFNNSKETSNINRKSIRSFPAQFHRDILELRVKYYYNNENGLISGAFHELEDDKQAELWNLLSSMEFLGNKKGYIAIQNTEKMIRLADWMYKNEYDDAEINSVLTMASSLLGNIFENKESEIKLNEDSITSCTVEQLELIIKLYCIKILIHNSKKDVINMIRCCGYYVNHKKKKEKKDSDTKNEDDEKELFSSFSEKCGFFPSSEKEWLMFSWPSIITEYIISYDDQPEILCMRTLNNAIYLVAACLNIVIESITLGCFSYAVPFLWLSLHLTTYWLNGIEQSKALCIIYALYSYYANKFGFKNLYCEYYFN
ncbi:hypothetical protein H8356DRAFT_1437307, partial [Neocallimastix lanati (nom. inval.)]